LPCPLSGEQPGDQRTDGEPEPDHLRGNDRRLAPVRKEKARIGVDRPADKSEPETKARRAGEEHHDAAGR
jgi:hypothetical protein